MATYKIIGHDQKEYGPLAEDQLRRWLAEGRVNGATKVQPEGAAGWTTLSALPEFATAPIAPAVSAAGAAPGFISQTATQTSALAIWSLVLGVLGIFTCGLSALVGLILGIMAMGRIKDSDGKLGGNGLALAGTIISGIFILLIPIGILAGMLLPALAAAKRKAQQISCVNNEKQLALSMRIYAGDNGNHFPAATNWCDAIKSTVGSDKIFHCPTDKPGTRCSYAYNAKLDGLDVNQVKPNTVLLFESDAGWDASGGPELLPGGSRHLSGINIVAFADGSVRMVKPAEIGTLQWNP